MRSLLCSAATVLALMAAAPLPAQSTTSTPAATPMAPDRAGVQRAALDYLEGFYEGDTSKFVRSIHPQVFKYGYYRANEGAAFSPSQMKFPDAFMAFARNVRETGRGAPPAGAPKEVIIYDVLDQTALAKVIAWWGIDYLLMAKVDGRWQITHILWQSPPAK